MNVLTGIAKIKVLTSDDMPIWMMNQITEALFDALDLAELRLQADCTRLSFVRSTEQGREAPRIANLRA